MSKKTGIDPVTSKTPAIVKSLIDPPQYIIISSMESSDAGENLDAGIYESIGREIQSTFGFQAQIKSLIRNINFAFDPIRNQYHSTRILEKLSDQAPLYAAKVIAVTGVDLFIPILTYVYGEAQLDGKACIISTYRLKEGLSLTKLAKGFEERIVKEALHELGHTFNLRHCKDKSCIMHYCRSIKDVDRKSAQLCRYCKILLTDNLKKAEIS